MMTTAKEKKHVIEGKMDSLMREKEMYSDRPAMNEE